MGIKAAVLGATGYTGMVLTRILERHPYIDIILPGTSTRPGTPLADIDAGFGISEKMNISDNKLMNRDDIAAEKPDVVFSCLPHLASAENCVPFFGKSVVIDLSADFRIPDEALFFAAYGENPPIPEKLNDFVYGLAEIYRDKIVSADLIAVPGCYPTCTLLPLLPVARELGAGGKIYINALSGISGAGKKAKEMLIYTERSENICAYSPGRTHRHGTEIQYYIDTYCGNSKEYTAYFTPHLVPLKRGMEVTTALELKPGVTDTDIAHVLSCAYNGTPFVRLRNEGLPETRETRGSNTCLINWHLDGTTLFLFSAIDNLVKGASGQAVQDMNIRFGFEEDSGLDMFGEV